MKSLYNFLIDLEDSDLATVLGDLSNAAKRISNAARVNVSLGAETGDKNVHGENVKEFDQLANMIFKEHFEKNRAVSVLISEEDEVPIYTDHQGKNQFQIFFDPLDGSSNISSNIAVGSIFSIYRHESEKNIEANLLPDLREQVCAGYVMYSTATILVLVYGGGIYEFMLDPKTGAFLMVNKNLKMTETGQKYYSINESNYHRWHIPTVRCFIDVLKLRGYSNRWVGTLVADFHRTLKQGSVFLYPGDNRNENGKLRLMYEAAPLSLIIEAAGGMAIHEDGTRILDIKPAGIHQKVPFIFGQKKEVQVYLKALRGKEPLRFQE